MHQFFCQTSSQVRTSFQFWQKPWRHLYLLPFLSSAVNPLEILMVIFASTAATPVQAPRCLACIPAVDSQLASQLAASPVLHSLQHNQWNLFETKFRWLSFLCSESSSSCPSKKCSPSSGPPGPARCLLTLLQHPPPQLPQFCSSPAVTLSSLCLCALPLVILRVHPCVFQAASNAILLSE